MTHLAHYLRTHLAGATSGVGLFEHAAQKHEGHAAAVLARIHGEVVEDRAALRRIMAALDVRPNPIGNLAAGAAERLSRVRTLARKLQDGPVTELAELEAMLMALTGKLAGWESLLAIADADPRLDRATLETLAQRARDQRKAISDLHASAARQALGGQ